MCFLPSLETFHAYRPIDEHSDGTPILMNLPAYDPSKRKDVRAQRAPDAPGTHPDMLYCEFKGCTIMVYGQINVCPIGSNHWPGWGATAVPARFYLTTDPTKKGKSKGKSKGKGGGSGRSGSGFSNDPQSKSIKPPKGKGRSRGRGKGKSDRDETQSREDRAARPDPKGPNTVPQCWKDRDYEDIQIVQNARLHDNDVAAYVQGTSEIPTFRVVWMTSLIGYNPKNQSGFTKSIC